MFVSIGALQIAVSVGGHRGWWLLPGKMLTRSAGVVLIITGVVLFLLQPLWLEGPWAAGSVGSDSSAREWGRADWGDLGAARNINDIDGGLAGAGQATWFPLSAIVAGLLSLAAATVNRRFFPDRMRTESAGAGAGDGDGLSTLDAASYPTALRVSWSALRRDLKRDAAALLDSSPRWSFSAFIWRRVSR